MGVDALHTQTDTVRFPVQDKKTRYLLTVKLNQRIFCASCRRLPWDKATAKYCDRAEGHGRKETRDVQVLSVSHLDFPDARQAARITRHRMDT
ncbi:hypothetical protein [Streptomyces sp. NBC_01614]|uniref:hypothetical protein n=1 Tax=Streptomyces sp. NBC_01614 TaxID=2975897 RepID=UPI00386B379E